MNRRNALFAGHDEGGRNWARFASLIGTCKMNGVEPYAYMRDLFIRIANGHPAKDIDALMPWAYTQRLIPSAWPRPGLPNEIMPHSRIGGWPRGNGKINGTETAHTDRQRGQAPGRAARSDH